MIFVPSRWGRVASPLTYSISAIARPSLLVLKVPAGGQVGPAHAANEPVVLHDVPLTLAILHCSYSGARSLSVRERGRCCAHSNAENARRRGCSVGPRDQLVASRPGRGDNPDARARSQQGGGCPWISLKRTTATATFTGIVGITSPTAPLS